MITHQLKRNVLMRCITTKEYKKEKRKGYGHQFVDDDPQKLRKEII